MRIAEKPHFGSRGRQSTKTRQPPPAAKFASTVFIGKLAWRIWRAPDHAFLYNRRERSVIHVQMAATRGAAIAELDACRSRDHLRRAWHPETAELSGPGAGPVGDLSFPLYGD